MQEIEICTYFQMVHAKTRIRPGEWDAQSSLGFLITNRSLNPSQKNSPADNSKKKSACSIVDFVAWEKNQKSEQKYKYLDLARELNMLWNM